MCYEKRDPKIARECWERDQGGKKVAEYIEREALRDDIRESYLKLQEIYETLRYERERDICSGELGTFCEVLMRIKDFPAADVAPVVHGYWIPSESDFDDDDTLFDAEDWCDWQCSACHTDICYEDPMERRWLPKFCPNCGARMDGE